MLLAVIKRSGVHSAWHAKLLQKLNCIQNL